MHTGKGRFDLLPWNAIMEVSKHCEAGALKYGEHNVDKGIPIHSLIDSGIRHIVKFWLRWEDEPHLQAACWNLLWALEMMLVKPEMDDRPGGEAELNLFDQEEIHENCTVQVFTNSVTGETSIGWWENKEEQT